MNLEEEIYVREMSIFDLRNYARDIGVRCPTIYGKEELTQKVFDILEGRTEPVKVRSKQGRPPKKASNPVNPELFKFNGFKDDASTNQGLIVNMPFDVQNKMANLVFEFGFDKETLYGKGSGYLRIMPDGGGFIFSGNKVSNEDAAIYIRQKFIDQFSLRQGDKVQCSYKFYTKEKTRTFTALDNQDKFTERGIFNGIKCKKPNELLPLEKEKIFDGSRVVVQTSSINKFTTFAKIFNSLPEEYEVINVALDLMPENAGVHNNVFYTVVGDGDKRNVFTACIVIDHVKRLVESGKKVVVVFDELLKLVKYQNFLCGINIGDIKEKTFELCLDLMKLGTSYENGGAVTVVACLKKDGTSNTYLALKNELENMDCQFIDL